MAVVAFSTATDVLAIGVAENGQLLAESNLSGRLHSERLMRQIAHLLEISGLVPAQLDAVGVTNGPGSYTGIRIGIAAAQGLAYAVGCPAVGLSTLWAMAASSQAEGLLLSAIDARRGNLFAALFQRTAGQVIRLQEDTFLPASQLTAWLSNQTTSVWLITPQREQVYPMVVQAVGETVAFDNAPSVLRGATLALATEIAWQRGRSVAPHVLQPKYLRAVQALTLQEQRRKEVLP
ncbi:MAG: tRNA (adenosine(37)-N6)-threonylcarbamoyltransferase complex dimerization subunit type 1 TsaB [Firmicutes bacterium]|nr:tRNA (adenosine(37)-N6)-threonylcarbamoyltransferase complex dimerization subunit type 1 TsaB [Bacillota bacterium]